MSEDELDDIKKYRNELQVIPYIYGDLELLKSASILLTCVQEVVESCDINKDGFIDWSEFMALIMEAKSTYIQSLFKTYDLNNDSLIDKCEMKTIVAQINDGGNGTRANQMREVFDFMLANFDENVDGKINVGEFTNYYYY